MIREVIQFGLRLGPETDRFRGLFRQVRERMERAGVVPGAVWTNLVGDARYFIVEYFGIFVGIRVLGQLIHGVRLGEQ